MRDKILVEMQIYYHSKELALEWYNRSNIYFDDNTPKEMVDKGLGQEVYDWITMAMDIG